MWITADVDLPDRLIEAQQNGDLVLFIGAGASLGKPSNLPLFGALTKEIGEQAGRPPTDDDLTRPDKFLGVLDDDDVQVHRLAKAILDVPKSTPNPLHNALVRLPRAAGDLRIVTTNYDRHLTTAAREAYPGVHIPQYNAPAVPLGDDFTGIVYLHGCLDDDPSSLILTDRDFGKAYLRKAWAARFLREMFEQYVVLFVGYSHGDVVLTYLARGLERDSVRFALHHEDGDWKALGITLVPYPKDDLHSRLTAAVEAWVTDSHLGLTGQRERTRLLVSGSGGADGRPPEDPADVAFLERIVASPTTIKFFTEFGEGGAWLDWISSQQCFRSLFASGPEDPEVARELAWWFTERFVLNDENSNAAMRTLQALGGTIGPHLWQQLAFRIANASPVPEDADRWIALLLLSADFGFDDALARLLEIRDWAEHPDIARLLLTRLTTPNVRLQPTFSVDTNSTETTLATDVRAEVTFPVNEYVLERAVAAAFRTHLSSCASDVVAVVERQLETARTLYRIFGGGATSFDPLSFSRSAIEPHSQDAFREAVDVIIDVGRDALVEMMRSDPAAATEVAQRWIRSDVPLLRRLAVHSWATRSDHSADSKLAWVLDEDLLYEYGLKHEVFRLLHSVVATASSASIERLLDATGLGPAGVEPQTRDYEVSNLLAWLNRAEEVPPKIAAAYAAFAATHDEFGERESPDLDWSTGGGGVPQRLPMSVDEFAQLLEADPRDALDRLAPLLATEFSIDGPSKHDALDLVALASSSRPDLGLRLITLVDQPGDADFCGAAITGLEVADLAPAEWASLFTALVAHPLRDSLASGISSLLERRSRKAANTIPVDQLDGARSLAAALWDGLGDVSSGFDAGWLEQAINTTPGRLAEFWIHSISVEAAAEGDRWTKLSASTRTSLTRMIAGNEMHNYFALAVIASQIHFLCSVDREWVVEELLPLFDIDLEEARSKVAWDGFFTWGVPTDRVLEAGLLQYFAKLFPRVHEFDARADEVADKAAAIAMYSHVADVHPAWVRDFHAHVGEELRVRWTRSVGRLLREGGQPLVDQAWDSWLRAYWTERVNDIPRHLDLEESSAIAEWILELGAHFREAVELATRVPAMVSRHGGFLYRMKDNDILGAYPLEAAHLVGHVLASTPAESFFACDSLTVIVERLDGRIESYELRERIREEGLRLGCHGAGAWFPEPPTSGAEDRPGAPGV